MLNIANLNPLLLNYAINDYYAKQEIPTDVIEYRRITQQGCFYEYLHDKTGVELKNLKQDITQNLSEIFPNVAKVIDHCEQEDTDDLTEELFAIRNSVIFQIFRRIVNEHRECVLLRVEAGILSTKDNIESIMQIIENEIYKSIGLYPTIVIERLDADYLQKILNDNKLFEYIQKNLVVSK